MLSCAAKCIHRYGPNARGVQRFLSTSSPVNSRSPRFRPANPRPILSSGFPAKSFFFFHFQLRSRSSIQSYCACAHGPSHRGRRHIAPTVKLWIKNDESVSKSVIYKYFFPKIKPIFSSFLLKKRQFRAEPALFCGRRSSRNSVLRTPRRNEAAFHRHGNADRSHPRGGRSLNSQVSVFKDQAISRCNSKFCGSHQETIGGGLAPLIIFRTDQYVEHVQEMKLSERANHRTAPAARNHCHRNLPTLRVNMFQHLRNRRQLWQQLDNRGFPCAWPPRQQAWQRRACHSAKR